MGPEEPYGFIWPTIQFVLIGKQYNNTYKKDHRTYGYRLRLAEYPTPGSNSAVGSSISSYLSSRVVAHRSISIRPIKIVDYVRRLLDELTVARLSPWSRRSLTLLG